MSAEQASGHKPVLLDEVVRWLSSAEACRDRTRTPCLFDGTLGGGGHAEALLERLERAKLFGCDRDPLAVKRCAERLSRFGDRVVVVEGGFGQLGALLELVPQGFFAEAPRFDGMLLDLGISSYQLDDPARGFSFSAEGPLDMRMGAHGASAADIVNESTLEELQLIFNEGGVPHPYHRALAREVIKRRPVTTTGTFAQICVDVLGVREHRRREKNRGKGQHPATVPFQSLRIAVNNEFEQIGGFLSKAVDLLNTKGRLAIISFHSLEDQLVTQTMRRWSRAEELPRELRHAVEPRPLGKLLTQDAVVPDEIEIDDNPRSRSARMRVFEKW